MKPANIKLINQLAKIVGNKPSRLITDELLMAKYLGDWRGFVRGRAQAVVFPKNTDEVSKIVKLLNLHNIQIVAQGGNSCQTAAAVPLADTALAKYPAAKLPVIINLSLLNKIINIDTTERTICVCAGAILAEVQKKVAKKGFIFPLDLGAKKVAQIGGLLSTNAGGLNVLRYGNTRDLCLGLEVVLPNGEVLSMLRNLRKNNTGYDLKHLFIGAEGTLGIITQAVFKLYPAPKTSYAIWLTAENFSQCIRLFDKFNSRFSSEISAFEIINHESAKPLSSININLPLPINSWQILVQLDFQNEIDLPTIINSWQNEKGKNYFVDYKIASSTKDKKSFRHFWQCRENVPEAAKFLFSEKNNYKIIRHDIGLPISAMSKFFTASLKKIKTQYPQAKTIIFGHLGDGNLHFNIVLDTNSNQKYQFNSKIVYDMVMNLAGTFSAEHGIGQLKVSAMKQYLAKNEIMLMKKLRETLDPKQIFNRGKLFD